MTTTSTTARRVTAELAPYALVRVAALPQPPPTASPLRSALEALSAAEAEIAALAPALGEALHDSAGTHSSEFHRRVVLPLRRDLHNGRAPRPALLAALGTLPRRVPLLAEWLSARESAATLAETALRAWPAALAAERAVLATLCRSDSLRRAAVLTGADLLHGLDRTAAAGGNPDRKARKVEATVLRYALRATAKTSPLSWYTHVGWGRWGDGPWPAGQPVAHAEVHRLLLTRLVDSLGARLPHRPAPGLRERDGRVLFRRDVPVGTDHLAQVTREEEVDVAATGPLRFVIATARAAGPDGSALERIAGALAATLSVPDPARTAEDYVARLRGIGLVVPVMPVDPQDRGAVRAVASWLREHDEPAADDLTALADTTAAFATADPPTRAAIVGDLADGWRRLGERVGAGLSGVPPVLEDVVLPEPVPVPDRGTDALTRLTPLLVLFDQQVLLRRLARTRFVERFGEGGVASPADCAAPLALAWLDVLDIGSVRDPEVVAVLRARERVAAMVSGGVIPDEAVAEASGLLPDWAGRRPGSYSFFVQPTADGGLVVNRVHTGFGKFTSRFLDLLPGLRDEVAERLAKALGPGYAQFRPVRGFNANLHPLLGAREVGEDARWADLPADELAVWHDPVADEVRVTHPGEPLDLLYLGFLVPVVLPDRQVPLYSDLACGWVDLDPLRESTMDGPVTRRGPLRFRDVVLARRSWDFPTAPRVGAEDSSALDAARLRARYGLPEHVFVGPDTDPLSAEPPRRTGKPQYVDLGNALHLRCLPRLLARFPEGVRVTEALPVPGLLPPGERVVELIAETYWRIT